MNINIASEGLQNLDLCWANPDIGKGKLLYIHYLQHA